MTVAAIAITVLLVLIFNRMNSPESNTLVISTASSSAAYSGEALTDDRWSLLEGELKEGHKLSVTVTGSQTNVGKSENSVTAKVKDKTGADVTSEYTLVYRPGSLTVKARSLTISASSAMKPYDGIPLLDSTYTVENPSVLVEGATLEVVVSGEITDIGTADNKITAVSIYGKNGENITKNYSIKTQKGELRVYSPLALVIKSADACKPYDGNPLTCEDWKLLSGELMPGHELLVLVDGTITRSGSAENGFSASVIDTANGNMDVTDMYELVKIYGELVVLRQ